MQHFTVTGPEGERFSLTLHSLDEYQAAGGIYFDGGNGGGFATIDDDEIDGPVWTEDGDLRDDLRELNIRRAREQFVCAASADGAANLPENDQIELAGVDRSDYWLDSASGFFLLRDWPREAPLVARMVG